ncbi:hypothetical protein skT53_26330 [Effusibacillus dendaii]|uniref:Uncharacterized protein n=1 Tax=Effusibacillus dendaii TaxID=2743772 RepID=A0A7I8DBV7_9BACL|nr:hypothetical protein skT53_26330 [Effusibacillus dendaii]
MTGWSGLLGELLIEQEGVTSPRPLTTVGTVRFRAVHIVHRSSSNFSTKLTNPWFSILFPMVNAVRSPFSSHIYLWYDKVTLM